jgi:hypothetical protein
MLIEKASEPLPRVPSILPSNTAGGTPSGEPRNFVWGGGVEKFI